MRRPLRDRVWAWKPNPGYLKPEEGFFLPKGWWKPWGTGGDEFNWHTAYVGNPVTGMLILATRPCPRTGECGRFIEECVADGVPRSQFENEWPVDAYGHNHVRCDDPGCHCKEEDDGDEA